MGLSENRHPKFQGSVCSHVPFRRRPGTTQKGELNETHRSPHSMPLLAVYTLCSQNPNDQIIILLGICPTKSPNISPFFLQKYPKDLPNSWFMLVQFFLESIDPHHIPWISHQFLVFPMDFPWGRGSPGQAPTAPPSCGSCDRGSPR